MSDLAPSSAGRLPEAPRPGDGAAEVLRAILLHPSMVHDVGLSVLSRMALDEKTPAREKRRCGEVLAQLKIRATEVLGALTGSKEQHLHALGISQAPQEVHVEQHNTKIEIVREGQRDWRTTEPA